MGKPLMIQIEDDQRLESLKKSLGASSKVDVLRTALSSLERELQRKKRVEQWMKAVRIVSKQSAQVNKEFQKHSLLKKNSSR